MTNGNEGTTGDLAANLAALRQDVARLVDTISGLVQHQTQAAVIASLKLSATSRTGSQVPPPTRRAVFVQRAARSRPISSVIR